MAWIKRNLFFVISMLVGLALTGYCGILFMGDYSKNSQVNDDYQSTIGQLNDFQKKVPYPSPENIAKAKEDLTNINAFVSDVRKVFVPFPTPPHETEEGFSAYLETAITDLTVKATNAGVKLPDSFAFTFTDLRGKLNFDTNNIPVWMEQWEELKAICNILYRAKINSLVSLARVQASGTEQFSSGAEWINSATTTNSITIVRPYKITFKSFDRELAEVLNGFTHSSNCFLIKNIVVYPAEPVSLAAQSGGGGGMFAPATPQRPPPIVPTIPFGTPPEQRTQIMRRYTIAMENYNREIGLGQRPQVAAGSTAPGAPVTILREHLLLVTLAVEVIKVKGS